MRVLLVNQYYPPDVAPTGQCLRDLARRLVARGHSVEVLCSRRSYEGGRDYPPEEMVEGVRVVRAAGFAFGREGAARVAGYVSFLAAAAGRGLRSRLWHDLTLCLTTPPYVGWVLPRVLGRRAGVVVQWVMDLYPDVVAAHGGLRGRTLLFDLLSRLTRRQMRRSELVLTLGPRMTQRVGAYVGRGTRLESIPLWAPAVDAPASMETITRWRQSRGWNPQDVVLLYSGNMGLGHRFEEFLAAADALADPSRTDTVGWARDDEGTGLVWAFAGGGARRRDVERFAAESPRARIQLLPYVDQADLPASLAAADVHLVSLRSPWQGLIVPSKLQAAFGVGRPVIFVGPRDCEPADWVAACGGGWIVGEGDVEGLLRAVDEARDPAERRRRGEAGRAYARVHFDRTTNTNRIADLLEEVAESGRRARS